jgi:hypothetical protein
MEKLKSTVERRTAVFSVRGLSNEEFGRAGAGASPVTPDEEGDRVEQHGGSQRPAWNQLHVHGDTPPETISAMAPVESAMTRGFFFLADTRNAGSAAWPLS